jgi:hypothetical protein
MAWANKSATALICQVCGYVHTFQDRRGREPAA